MKPIQFEVDETTMSEYIKGFDAGYAYVLAQIERHPHLTMAEILVMLKGENDEVRIAIGGE